MLLSILFFPITLASAYVLPSSAPSASTSNTCTFTLLHRQQQSETYILLNKIVDHANSLTINIASTRPASAFNSYIRLSPPRAFAISGLLDNERLTITTDGADELGFEVGLLRWASDVGRDEAWCEAGPWTESGRSRERWLHCTFPCEQVSDEEEEEEEEEEEGVFEGPGQSEQERLRSL